MHTSSSPSSKEQASPTTSAHSHIDWNANVSLPRLPSDLEAEIQGDDFEFATFGGDDPHDPTLHHHPPTLDSHGLNSFRVLTSSLDGIDLTAVNSKTEDADAATKLPWMVGWDGPDDPMNPQNFNFRRKVAITAVITLLTVNTTFSSSAPSPALAAISEEFNVSSEISLLITSLFLIGYVCGPIVWSGLSEMFGRRIVFIISGFAYTLLLLGQALAPNMVTLLVTRFLCGVFISAPLSNGGGVIADIWGPAGRGPAVTIYLSAVFTGPALGPIVTSFIVSSHLGWRWVFWLLMILGGASWVISALILPETYAPVILQAKARRLRKGSPSHSHVYAELDLQDQSFTGILQRTILRPFLMLMKELTLVLLAIYLALVYGLIYATFEVFPIIFEEIRGFKTTLSGLMFIGVVIGVSLGACISIWHGIAYRKLLPKWRGHPLVEERLRGAMIGGPLLAVSIFWLGWSGAYAGVPWYIVELSTIPFGMSVSLVFTSFFSYLVDSYLMYSASALAGNSMVRSAVGAGFPLFTNQMFHNLGVQWAGTLLGCISLLLAPMPFFFFKYGALARTKSTFSPCLDLKIKAELERQERELKSSALDV